MSQYLNNAPKTVGTAYPLLAFFGFLGVHRFYIRSTGLGILYLFTLGLLGIGPLVDLFRLSGLVHDCNEKIGQGRS